jgi:LysM repeat protein
MRPSRTSTDALSIGSARADGHTRAFLINNVFSIAMSRSGGVLLENGLAVDYVGLGMADAKHLLRTLPLAFALAAPLASGCLATYGVEQSRSEAALIEDMRLLQEENSRLKGRLEAFDLEIERLSRSVDLLRTAPGGPTHADVQALQQRVAALESQLRALDAARERDRKEIIDTLTARISQVVSASGAARARPAAQPQTAPRRNGPQEGYEHVVEAGQSLSAIAAAYGVSPKAIIEANNLTNPNVLRVGQKLFIPAN